MHKLKLGQMRDITINYCLVGGPFVITCTLAYTVTVDLSNV